MIILSVNRDRFQIGAVVHESAAGKLSCELRDAFDAVEAAEAASVDRLLNYFKLVAERGMTILNDKQCHVIDPDEKIYEFIAGRLRVVFFVGVPKSVIVCSHMFLKKSQKTPPAEINKAIRAQKRYLAARDAGTLEWRNEID